MTNENSTEPEPVQPSKNRSKGPSDLVTGLLTVIAFVIFMTLWMCFA